jgi:multiple sugar transport system permease protein
VTAFIAVVAASVWTFAPLGMILLTAGLQSIPHSLYEAAMVDGASRWQRFLNITVPALKPVLYTTAFLLFIYTFKTFDTIFLMTGGGPGGATKILPVYAYEQAFIFFKFGKAAVATTILLVIPTVLSILYFHSIKKEERS